MQRLIRKAELLVEGTRIEALAWIRNRLFMAFAFAWHMTHMPESSRLHQAFHSWSTSEGPSGDVDYQHT